VPPRPGGLWDAGNTALAAGTGLAVLLGSVWMVYELEILKARHLEALRLRRTRPAVADAIEPAGEREAAVEEVLTAGRGAGAPADRAS
jgi:hypothetical protein